MSCNINDKSLLGDISSSTLDGLKSYIEKQQSLTGKSPSVMAKAGGSVGKIYDIHQLQIAAANGGTKAVLVQASSIVGSIAGTALAVAFVGTGVGAIAIVAVAAASYAGSELGEGLGKMLFDPTIEPSFLAETLRNREALLEMRGVDPNTDPGTLRMREQLIEMRRRAGDCDMEEMHDAWNKAKGWQAPRDPIILDLDGNGLNTLGLNSGVYFDHDGSGILTRTGWVGEGDALLVWDRNVNGLIDYGAELFGDFTPMPDGTLAPNGFAALAALDPNGDGILDASDSAFAELKLWVDSDQNGVTGEGELMSLADAGIASLNLGNTLKNQKQSNGNTLAREGSFTRTDGTESAMGEFHLAIDTSDSFFIDEIEVPESISGLPNMFGSGNVRDLRQAAAQSNSLELLLSQFQQSSNRDEQKALVDQILTSWANTSGMATSLDSRAKGEFRIEYEAFGNVRRSAHIVNSGAGAAGPSNTVGSGASLASDSGNQNLTAEYRALMSEWSNKLHVLEAFNGQYFFNLPDKKSLTPSANHGFSVVQPSSKPGTGGAAIAAESTPLLRINFAQQQLDLLQKANQHKPALSGAVLRSGNGHALQLSAGLQAQCGALCAERSDWVEWRS